MTKEKKGLGKGLNAFFSDDNLLDNVIKKDDKKIYDILKNASDDKYEMLLDIFEYIK